MSRLRADRRDYLTAYKKHYHAYINWNNTGSEISRYLILSYCVECGIKYMVMEKEGIITISSACSKLQDALYDHDIKNLLVNYLSISQFRLPNLVTRHKETVPSASFHQACRYALFSSKENGSKFLKYINELIQISNWIAERIGGI